MAPCWRIDELAQRAGCTVDTIRYYAREGLLSPPERSGRHKLYGPDHLDRLERIKDLQAKRFSLAAIRAVLDAEFPGLESVFASEGTYQLADLVERSSLTPEIVELTRTVGLLPDPIALGREHYDDGDLDMLRAVEELLDVGMTPEIIEQLGRLYVRTFAQLQREVHDLFAGNGLGLGEDELLALQLQLTEHSARMIPAIDRLLSYVHQRSVQRMTFEAMNTARETGTGIGGVRLADD